MEKVKIVYPISSRFNEGSDSYGMPQFIAKAVMASLCGASIPAVIFYFLM